MAQIIFDGGIFAILLIIGFACLAFYKKIGALMLVIPVIFFLISGLVILTGEDVAFFKVEHQGNYTQITENLTKEITITTFSSISASNETSYLIGNGQFPITGIGQLWMGYSLILLSLMLGVIFLDQTLKGNLVKGD